MIILAFSTLNCIPCPFNNKNFILIANVVIYCCLLMFNTVYVYLNVIVNIYNVLNVFNVVHFVVFVCFDNFKHLTCFVYLIYFVFLYYLHIRGLKLHTGDFQCFYALHPAYSKLFREPRDLQKGNPY